MRIRNRIGRFARTKVVTWSDFVSTRLLLRNPKLGLLLALLLAGSMWFYVERVLIPYQEADAAAHGRPRGILSDLYPRWIGTRELLFHHRDPYSPEVTREIQIGYYGRILDPNRPEDPKDEQRFTYPVYVVFFIAPTTTVPFPMVRVAFTWLLEIVTAVSVLLWLRVVRWRVSSTTLAILLILTRSEEHTSELQSRLHLVCRLLL